MPTSFPAAPALTEGLHVSAADLNTTINPLIERTAYLKEHLDILETDGTLTAIRMKNLTLPPELAVAGTPVYFDGTDWQLAQAGAMTIGEVEVDVSSFVVGIVETSSTIVMAGKSTLINGTSLKLQSGEIFEEGPYYLSAQEAGTVTKVKPAVAVYLGTFFTAFCVIMPSFRDNADAHLHYGIPLSNQAAGYVHVDGGSYTLFGFRYDADVAVTAPDYATPVFTTGLSSFSSAVPLVYSLSIVYNAGISYDITWAATDGGTEIASGLLEVAVAELYDVIHVLDATRGISIFFRRPPTGGADNSVATYTAAKVFTVDAPSEVVGWIPADSGDNGTQTQPALFDLPANLVDPTKVALYVYNMGFDETLSSVYPPVPLGTCALIMNGAEMWEATKFKNSSFAITPTTLLWVDSVTRPWMDVSEAGPYEPQVLLSFVRRSAGNTGVVTSLASGEGSPIRFRRKGSTADATTGDLEAFLNLTLATGVEDLPGYLVVKEASDNVLKRGPVVEKILLGGGLVFEPVAGYPVGQGVVKIASEDASLAGSFDNIALENAKQGKVGMFTFVAIPAKTTVNGPGYGFTANFQIPYKTPADTEYQVRLVATVFGDKGVTGGVAQTASLKFSYSILPDSNNETISLEDARTGACVRGTYAVTFPDGYAAYDPVKIGNGDGELLGDLLPADGEISYLATAVVKNGDSIGIKFESGTGAADYTGNLGFMNLRWQLVQV